MRERCFARAERPFPGAGGAIAGMNGMRHSATRVPPGWGKENTRTVTFHAQFRLASGLVMRSPNPEQTMETNTIRPNPNDHLEPVTGPAPDGRPKRKRLLRPVFRTHLFRA